MNYISGFYCCTLFELSFISNRCVHLKEVWFPLEIFPRESLLMALFNPNSPPMARNPARNRQDGNSHSMQVTIFIDGNSDNHSPIYTTGSIISGKATIRSSTQIYCDEAEIVLLGFAGTRLELTRHKPTHAFSPFLKMYMMAEQEGGRLELDSPFPGRMVSGQTISIPFSFVVPQFLLEDSCRHPCASYAVWERHTRLPPTLDKGDSGHEFHARGRIQYYVEMRLRCYSDSPGPFGEGYLDSKLIAGRKQVTILPALPELPPLPIHGADDDVFLRKRSLVVRKNFLQRAGTLIAFSSQPPAMMLDPFGQSSPCSVLLLELDFIPIDPTCRPPRKLAISGVVRGTTHLCAEPSQLLPEFSRHGSGFSDTDGKGPTTVQYSSAQDLFPPTPQSPVWQQLQDDAGDWHYRTELELPLELPAEERKPVLPTFYSCLISQTYLLEIKLFVGSATPRLSLTLPLQIGVCSINSGRSA